MPPPPPPPGNGFTKSAMPQHWVGFSFKINKSPRCWDMLSSIYFLGRFLTEEYVNLHRNQVSPALGRIFISYMICPGFGLVICEKTCPGVGLSFGFHGVHLYQKNICSHPPPPPPRRGGEGRIYAYIHTCTSPARSFTSTFRALVFLLFCTLALQEPCFKRYFTTQREFHNNYINNWIRACTQWHTF